MRRLREALTRWLRTPRRASATGGSQAPPHRSARTTRPPTHAPGPDAADAGSAPVPTGYPGDFTGAPELRWAPQPDGHPDPGEVVWTWVPFEEDHTKGKDRPVLLVGRDGPWLLGVPLTSKDHDRDLEQERRAGRLWCDVGSGAWDGRRRPSEARVDRIVRVDPAMVRREGAVLSQPVFDQVAAAIRAAR